MIFGSLPLAEAKGAILAHGIPLPGRTLCKGSVLSEDTIAALAAAGHETVVAARIEAGEVPENTAVDRIATALLTPLIGRSHAAMGRVNLWAEVPGLLRVNVAAVDRINQRDESITLATLPDYAVVAAKEMIATIKVIPFAVAAALLAATEALARQEKPALILHPFRPHKVGLVLTELSGMEESVARQTIAATAQRVTGLTGTLLPPVHALHAAGPIADALKALHSQGAEILLIAGASVTVDRCDVAPEGIARAGGHIIRFGMPVDPGNLACFGAIGGKPALVLPGCARSAKPSGIDVILARLFAGLPVGPAQVAAMGVGGLMQDIEARPMPRMKAPSAPRVKAGPGSAPAVAAIVLAAGRSRRMAPQNKLLIAGPSGDPIIARVVDNVLSSTARPVLVVTGHQADAIESMLGGRPVRFVHASDYAQGLSASLKAGIAAVPAECAGAIVCLGDMPLVTGAMIDRLIAAFAPDEGRAIVLPNFRGKQGNPMLWGRRFFAEIATISGDVGARFLLARHLDQLVEVDIADEAVLRDVDTPEALAAMPKQF